MKERPSGLLIPEHHDRANPARSFPIVFPWTQAPPSIDHIWRPDIVDSITENNLTTGLENSGTATNANTASVTPGSNRLVLVSVWNFNAAGGTPATLTVTGNSLTYVQVFTTTTSANVRLSVFRALGVSPSAGVINISAGATQQLAFIWSVAEFLGVDTSGTNGSGAIVQSAAGTPGTGTAQLTTLAAFSAAENMAYGAFIHSNVGATYTLGSGFTLIHNQADALFTQYKLNDPTVDATLSGSDTYANGALEIKAAVASGLPDGDHDMRASTQADADAALLRY